MMKAPVYKTKKRKISLEKIPGRISDSEILTLLQSEDINWEYIELIKKLTAYKDDTISRWLNINVKTFRSYKKPESRFKDNIKEHILLLLSLIKHGIRVFGSRKEFEQWLNTPNFYLNNKPPVFYLNTVTGIRFIDDRLTAMEYGDNV